MDKNKIQINDATDTADRKLTLIIPFQLYKKLRVFMVDNNYNSLNTVGRLLLEEAIKTKTLSNGRGRR